MSVSDPKLKPKVKAKWTGRLKELPNILQGTNNLKNPSTGKMCCLGVLCEIAVEEGIIPPGEVVDSYTVRYGGDHGSTMLLPDVVIEWAYEEKTLYNPFNFDAAANPKLLNDKGEAHFAVYWNDYSDANFDQIADMIDSTL